MISKKEIVRHKKYNSFLKDLVTFLEQSRRQAAQAVNVVLTATYWDMGRRIVEFEQAGSKRADYGEELLKRLSQDLTKQFRRGFSVDNLELMRLLYLSYPPALISESLTRIFSFEELSMFLDYLGHIMSILFGAFRITMLEHFMRKRHYAVDGLCDSLTGR